MLMTYNARYCIDGVVGKVLVSCGDYRCRIEVDIGKGKESWLSSLVKYHDLEVLRGVFIPFQNHNYHINRFKKRVKEGNTTH